MIEKAKEYPLSCILVASIWIVCMIPVPETPLDDISFIDKWTHFVMYGTLTLTIWWEYAARHKENKRFNWKRLLLGGIVCPIVMGCLVELAQAYLTTCRSGDWFDAACNTIGVFLGGFIGYFAIALYKNK